MNVDVRVSEDLNCPTPEELNEFERAVRSGAITWHSFPFNAETEMYTPELFKLP